ncbi:MAG: M14 family zinc carboxypeptidase, partial [Bacteroidales bacterium]
MKRYFLTFIIAAAVSASLSSQELKTPEQFLGYPPGEQFTFQHSLTDYFRHVADASPRAVYLQYGETWEGRPLSVCIVSSPENLAMLEQIRLSNLQRTGLADGMPEVESLPIVWLAYSVHGSEPAGAEASMKVLHALVAEEYDGAGEWLKNMIIIIDPCQNPDGRDLFTSRYLRAQGWPPSSDPNAWEHNQGWPSARLNHYLFDLNRDWSWHVQRETQARMKLYNRFMPHVHADFHEMGSGSTYFFPPGAEPWHEVITPWQREFHALTGKKASGLFDASYRLYYTKDNFDLFCPSFGDTWPLFNGAMGYTLEQGGGAQAGLALRRDDIDTLTLAQRVEGHFLASMAVLSAADENRERLLREFYEFFRSGAEKPPSKYKTIIIKGTADAASLNSLKQLLASNQIRYDTPRVTGKKITAWDY